MSEFAGALPTMVVGEMLGIPMADRAKVQGWAQTLVASFGAPDFPVDVAEQNVAYLRRLIAWPGSRASWRSGALLQRFPKLRPAVPTGELVWSQAMFVHRLEKLPLLLLS